jgi:hypothetical protein
VFVTAPESTSPCGEAATSVQDELARRQQKCEFFLVISDGLLRMCNNPIARNDDGAEMNTLLIFNELHNSSAP